LNCSSVRQATRKQKESKNNLHSRNNISSNALSPAGAAVLAGRTSFFVRFGTLPKSRLFILSFCIIVSFLSSIRTRIIVVPGGGGGSSPSLGRAVVFVDAVVLFAFFLAAAGVAAGAPLTPPPPARGPPALCPPPAAGAEAGAAAVAAAPFIAPTPFSRTGTLFPVK
jgi:hypothetical protein